jgi:hypothetical protein
MKGGQYDTPYLLWGNTKLCGHESSQRVPTAAAGSGSWKVNEVSVTESGLFSGDVVEDVSCR